MIDDAVIEGIVKISNSERVIQQCEAHVCWHEDIKDWQVRRVLAAIELFYKQWRKVKEE